MKSGVEANRLSVKKQAAFETSFEKRESLTFSEKIHNKFDSLHYHVSPFQLDDPIDSVQSHFKQMEHKLQELHSKKKNLNSNLDSELFEDFILSFGKSIGNLK